MKNFFRNLWFEYRSELYFGLILSVMTVLSYWLGAFIPEDIFERYINPIQYVATVTVCFYGAWAVYRHSEGIIIRKSWATTLFIWGCIDVALMVVRYAFHITAVGGTPDDPLFNASVSLGNILAWLLYIYPSQILRPGWLTWWRAGLCITPMVLLTVVDYFLPANLLPLILVFPLFIFLLLCSHVRKYKQWCEDNFSTMDNIGAQWIVRYLTMLFLLGLSFYFICVWFVPNRMFTQQWLLLLILAYSTEQIIFRPDPWSEVQRGVLPHAEISNEESESLYLPKNAEEQKAILEKWFEDEKPYLNPDFRMQDLRQILPLNRTYLSKLINAEYGCSFYQLVSHYRVEEAKRLLTVNPTLRITDVAVQTGFSSSTVFSRIFFRETGLNPSEWALQQSRSEADA